MTKVTLKRASTHALLGGAFALIGWVMPLAGLSLCILFLGYESVQDRTIKDNSYIDIRWLLVGVAVVSGALAIYEKYGKEGIL